MKPQNGSYAALRSLYLVDGQPGDTSYGNIVQVTKGGITDYGPLGNNFQPHRGSPTLDQDGNLLFDGTDDVLKFPIAGSISGSDSFTVDLDFEYGARTTGVTHSDYEYVICGQYNTEGSNRCWAVFVTEATGVVGFRTSSNGGPDTIAVTYTAGREVGQRMRLSFEKVGAVATIYHNGVRVAEGTAYATLPSRPSVPYSLGGMSNATGLTGYFGQCAPIKVYGHRITKGARYGGSSFMPPKWLGLAAAQDAVRVDASAAITSSLTPEMGAIEDLQTGSTMVRLGKEMAYPHQFIQWDFGAGALPPTKYRAAVFDSEEGASLLSGYLQWSADGINWVDYAHDTSFFKVDGGQALPFSVAEPFASLSATKKASFGPIPPWQTKRAADARRQDQECGGRGSIYGTVELYAQAGNIPLPRRVRLHRSRDGLLVRETWSDAQGNYRFDGITDRYKYDVIAWDHEGLQQSVVANDLMPEVMP
ncbi:hypothetical protein [Comamonas jiangduensis]|uniref:hypothetical protein n=2 Tax=Comamonas jiangduensis TaxID=1194168 RepID=UPI003BF7A78C